MIDIGIVFHLQNLKIVKNEKMRKMRKIKYTLIDRFFCFLLGHYYFESYKCLYCGKSKSIKQNKMGYFSRIKNNKKRYDESRKEGLCTDCNEKALHGIMSCRIHKEKRLMYQRQRRKELK